MAIAGIYKKQMADIKRQKAKGGTASKAVPIVNGVTQLNPVSSGSATANPAKGAILKKMQTRQGVTSTMAQAGTGRVGVKARQGTATRKSVGGSLGTVDPAIKTPAGAAKKIKALMPKRKVGASTTTKSGYRRI